MMRTEAMPPMIRAAPGAALPVRVVELDLDELVLGVGRQARFDLAGGHASVSVRLLDAAVLLC